MLSLVSPATAQEITPVQPVDLSHMEPSGVAVADVDGDGRRDIVAVHSDGTRASWYRNLSPGAFGPASAIPGPQQGRLIQAADLTNNGQAEIVVGGDDGRLTLIENFGAGQFSETLVWDFNGFQPADLQIVDLDGDGDLDVAAAVDRQGLVGFMQGSPGSFGPPIVLAGSGKTAERMSFGDVNGDGLIDAAWTYLGLSTSDVRISFGTGPGTFGPVTLVTFAPRVRGVLLADLDGDRDLDLAWEDPSSSLAAHWNDGTGQFSPQVVLSTNPGNGQLYAADLDDDGADELVNLSAVWDLTTGGTFRSIPLTGDASYRALGDVDLDGIPDLACSDTASEEIFWLGTRLRHGIGERFCDPAVPNSTNLSSRVRASGSDLVFLNNLTLEASQLPLNTFGIFFLSRTLTAQTTIPHSQGLLCLAGNVGRFIGPGQILSSGQGGIAALSIDLTAVPQLLGTTPILPGETWGFQFWHRDFNPGSTSNISGGLAVPFQ